MNIDKLLRIIKREAKGLEKYNIRGPVYADSKKRKILFTDGYAAVVVPVKWADLGALGDVEPGAEKYEVMVGMFNSRTAETSSFQTSVGVLAAWLRSQTDVCPLCHGKKACKVFPHKHDLSADEEDAESLHYAWIGTTPFDRRRMDELLTALGPSPEEEVEVVAAKDFAVVESGHSVVKVVAKQWEIYIAGRSDVREAAPKFHLEAAFTNPQWKPAKRKRG